MKAFQAFRCRFEPGRPLKLRGSMDKETELILEIKNALLNSKYGRPHDYGRFLDAYLDIIIYALLPLLQKERE